MNIFRQIDFDDKKPKFINKGVFFSYSNLFEEIKKFNLNSEIKSLAFIISENSYECLSGYCALSYNNFSVGLIENATDKNVIDNILNRFKPLYVYQPNYSDYRNDWKPIHKLGHYVLYKTSFSIDYEINENLSTLIMTSGSTGCPEFVRLSYENIYDNTKNICKYLKVNKNDRAITTLPMSYSYGLSIINTHLFSNSSIVLTKQSFMQNKIWTMINDFSVTTFGGVPYIFEILKRLNFDNLNMKTVKYITQAGGKLNSGLETYLYDACRKKNIKFFIMYGQAEASPRMSYLPYKMLSKKRNSIGIPIPNGKLSLADENGKIIKNVGQEGELVYCGANVCLGYALNAYDLKKGDLNNGILKTGDLAIFDEDGYFYITGRKKRFVKIFGNRISLDYVEQSLYNQGVECVCVGNDDLKIKVFTINKKNIQKINIYFKKTLKLNKSYFDCHLIDFIPRNQSGKILYSKLKI